VALETERATTPKDEGGEEGAATSGSAAFFRDIAALPNIVSLARVVLVYVALGFWVYGRYAICMGIGLVAGLSDYLDGYLARRFNQSTRIGGLIDQAADILFMMGVIFVFVREGVWPSALLFTVMFRETLVMNLRASAAEQGFAIPSIFLGKWSSNWMFWSLAVMGCSLGNLFPEPLNTWARYVAHFGMLVGITCSVITAGIYLRTYVRSYKPTPRKAAG
jgi:cardiolipin synthase